MTTANVLHPGARISLLEDGYDLGLGISASLHQNLLAVILPESSSYYLSTFEGKLTALCDSRLGSELTAAQQATGLVKTIRYFNGAEGSCDTPSLETMMAAKSAEFTPVDTSRDDIALIAFTSGTTGRPKGTIHFHRDVMAMCICVCDHLLHPRPEDIFAGSAPIAFTYGLGMDLAFPLHAGASTVLLESSTPPELASAIETYGVTICATAPTAYRAMLAVLGDYDFSSLRMCVSAGEHLSQSTYEAWYKATGHRLVNGLGTTEMIHIFISAAEHETRPGSIGKAVDGYRVCVLGKNDEPLPPGKPGRLAVKGPTACKYLADERQSEYVCDGWNVTGDICQMDENGYFWYLSRADDMIISSGYNISGVEVEDALLRHGAVQECAVVGMPNPQRGMIVTAFVVLKDGAAGSQELATELKTFVKHTIAPYKYPRKIVFTQSLPKTQTGKVQRHVLRERTR